MKNDKNTMACHTTPRLDALLKILQNSKSVADIGCDHAYLSILLARADENKKIIGADIKEGPLNRARENVERFGLSGRIELRLGDGLSPLKSGEVDTIVIAGMGALVISGILNEGAETAKNADRLILQPMSSAHELREFLYKNGYIIENEHLVREDRRIYTIIIAKSGDTGEFTPGDCYVSRALRQSGDALYREYVLKQKSIIENALCGMKNAKRSIDKQIYEKLVCELEEFYKEL